MVRYVTKYDAIIQGLSTLVQSLFSHCGFTAQIIVPTWHTIYSSCKTYVYTSTKGMACDSMLW